MYMYMYLLMDLAPWPSGVTVGWSNTSLFTRKLATTNPLLIPAATLRWKERQRMNVKVSYTVHCMYTMLICL